MAEKKTHVKVFVTKTNKFRARVTLIEAGKRPVGMTELGVFEQLVRNQETYEVSVGGEAWSRGKGRPEHGRIKEQTKRVLFKLIAEYAACFAGVNSEDIKKMQVTFDMVSDTIRVQGV